MHRLRQLVRGSRTALLERPDELKRAAPDLYGELKRFYGWDPGRKPPTKVRR